MAFYEEKNNQKVKESIRKKGIKFINNIIDKN